MFVIFILTYWGVFLIWTGHFRMLPIAVGQVVGPLIVAYFGREKRLVGWRNGLRATLFLLKQATLRERVPLLLETTDWLYTRPRLSAPQMREPFAELLTQSLARADTALLESLEPDDIARLVALVVRYPKGKLPDTLLVAAILALTDLQPESIPLRQKLHRLTHHSSPRVREAVEEFYRVPK